MHTPPKPAPVPSVGISPPMIGCALVHSFFSFVGDEDKRRASGPSASPPLSPRVSSIPLAVRAQAEDGSSYRDGSSTTASRQGFARPFSPREGSATSRLQVVEKELGKGTPATAVELLKSVLRDGERMTLQQREDVLYALAVLESIRDSKAAPAPLLYSTELDSNPQAYYQGLTTPSETSEFKSALTTVMFAKRLTSVMKSEPRVYESVSTKAEVQSIISQLDSWNDFNIFELSKLTAGCPLVHVGCGVLERHKLLQPFAISGDKLSQFLVAVEAMYRADNPYHNSTHAADVVQATHVILLRGLLGCFNDVELLSSLVGAICHDVGHPGVTNDFHIAEADEAAIQYNDRSVNENMHAAVSFQLMRQVNCFENLARTQFAQFRKDMVRIILATDMTNHGANLKALKELVQVNGGDVKLWKDTAPALDHVVHAADISNPARPVLTASRWADAVLTEFFAQGDRERAAGREPSMLCDRRTVTKPQSQVGFVSFVVRPTFEVLIDITDGLDEPLPNLQAYKDCMQEELDKAKAAAEASEKGAASTA